MAEGILKSVAGKLIDVQSAGSDPVGYVHPQAIEMLDEIDIDISGNTSKHMNLFLEQDVETVITVCGNADQACPTYPGQIRRYHWPFPDPAKAEGSEEEIREQFRYVRDKIRMVFTAYGRGRLDSAAD